MYLCLFSLQFKSHDNLNDCFERRLLLLTTSNKLNEISKRISKIFSYFIYVNNVCLCVMLCGAFFYQMLICIVVFDCIKEKCIKLYYLYTNTLISINDSFSSCTKTKKLQFRRKMLREHWINI